MQSEDQLTLPTLVDPKYNEPIMLVCEDEKDILQSRLLGSRSICEEMNKSQAQGKKEHMVVVQDFLREVLQPSAIVTESDGTTQAFLDSLPNAIRDLEGKIHKEENRLSELQDQVRDQLLRKSEELSATISKNTHLAHQRQVIDDYSSKLKQVVQSDPQSLAHVPKPKEALSQIEEMKASSDLPDYLFGLCKRQRAWRDHAPKHLLEWKSHQEKFYRERLQEAFKQENKNVEATLNFFTQQVERLADQVQQLVQEDDQQGQAFLELVLNTPESLNLVTNEMITPETKLVYEVNDNLDQGQGVSESLQSLTALQNVEFRFNTKSTNGLSELAKGFTRMSQLRSITFNGSGAHLSNEQAKQFYGEVSKVKEAFPQLQDLSFDYSDATLQKDGALALIKALSAVGGTSVSTLQVIFGGCTLTPEVGTALGDAIKHFKNLRQLKIDFGGFSIQRNELKDKGVISIIESLGSFAPTIRKLDLNFGLNSITDESLVVFNETFTSNQWPKLSNICLNFNRNGVADRGLRKLGKSLHLLPILTRLELNISQNKFELLSLKQLVQQLPAYLREFRINIRGNGLKAEELNTYVQQNGLEGRVLF